VSDPYVQGRLAARADPTGHGATTVFANSVPFLSEINAGLGAAGDTALNAFSGKPANFGDAWNAHRAEQAGQADEFQGTHPGATGLIKGVGLAGQVGAALATGGASEAPAVASTARTLVSRAATVGTRVARNATTGAAVAGVNAFAQPGTLSERVHNAAASLPSGAAFGAGIAEGANAFGTVAKVAGRYGSAAYGALDRAVTGLTANQKSALLPPDVISQGKDAALDYLTKLGVTPESLTAAQTRAGDAPITTAEAIGPQGISQATALARRPGTTPQVAADTMATRGGDRTQRILGHIQDTTGIDPTSARGSVDAVVANGQAAAKPLFDKALGDGQPVWNSNLEGLAQRPVIKKAIASVTDDLKNAGKNPDALGLTFMDDPSSWRPPADVNAEFQPTQYPRAAAPASQGPSLVKFIADNGGMKDDGGELSAMDADKWHVGKPYQRKLIGDGDSPDGWATLAHDAGYPIAAPGAKPTQNDLLDAIQGELRGRPLYARDNDPLALNARANADSADEQIYRASSQPTPDDHGWTSAPTSEPAYMEQPTAETWDMVRKAIGRQVERHPLTNAPLPDSVSQGNYGIGVATRDLTGALRDAIPGYGDALDTSGDYLSVKGAYDRAQGKLFGTSGANNDPRSFDSWFQGLKPGEQAGAKASVVNDLFTKLNNGQLQPSALNSPAVQSKLETAFGPDAASDLIGRMKIEADMSAASARMTPNTNSTTGDVVGSQDGGVLGDLAEAGMRAAGNAFVGNKAGVVRAIGSGVASLGRVAGQDSSMATRNAFGDYLYAPPEQTANALAGRATARLMSEPGGNAFAPRSITALQHFYPAAVGQDDQPNQ
jgi:hypothetical protein